MRRREFITLVGGAAAIPLVAGAQQPEPVRRIGVLMSTAADDPVGQARITAFRQGLQKLGWAEGKNVRIDIRWAGGNADLDRKFAAELVPLTPDVILATASPTVAALQGATRTVPIVFAHAVDPVGAGFVDSLARPGGNATGFVLFEYSISAKWLELLKEVAPSVTRVAVLRDPAAAAGTGQFGAIQSVAPSFGVELSPGQRARSRGDRACGFGLCALGERRPDRNGEPIDYNSSRSGHHPCGPAQTAGDLLRPFLRHRGRPDLLWD